MTNEHHKHYHFQKKVDQPVLRDIQNVHGRSQTHYPQPTKRILDATSSEKPENLCSR